MMRALALDLGKYNIRVNAVLPGMIKTDRWEKNPDFYKNVPSRFTPIGDVAVGEDVPAGDIKQCLNNAMQEGGGQTPAPSPFDRYQNDREHAGRGDRAAHRMLPNGKHTEDGGECEEYCALDERLDTGVA